METTFHAIKENRKKKMNQQIISDSIDNTA